MTRITTRRFSEELPDRLPTMSDQVMPGAEPQFVAGEDAGILALHDLGDTPQVMCPLTDSLGEVGFATDVPLLPGHGTDLDDLEHCTWDDWAAAAQLALDELTSRVGPSVIIGIGMGASLACWLAAGRSDVAGVVAINPRTMPVPPQALEMLEAMLADGTKTVPPLRPDVSTHTRVIAYPTVPVSTLISMFNALDDMKNHWDTVKCPVLCVTSARDHRVSPANADYLVRNVAGPVETLTLEKSFHLATLDVEHEVLSKAVVEFAKRVTS